MIVASCFASCNVALTEHRRSFDVAPGEGLNLALPEMIFLLKSYLHFLLKFWILPPNDTMLLLFDVEEFPDSLDKLFPGTNLDFR